MSVNTTAVEAKEGTRDASEIEHWIAEYLGELLEMPSEQIDINSPFEEFGLDSTSAIGMTDDLGQWLGKDVSPTLIFDFPSVKELSQHLA